jgi:hypothetical protein
MAMQTVEALIVTIAVVIAVRHSFNSDSVTFIQVTI